MISAQRGGKSLCGNAAVGSIHRMPDILFDSLRFRNLTVKNRIFRSNISGRFDSNWVPPGITFRARRYSIWPVFDIHFSPQNARGG